MQACTELVAAAVNKTAVGYLRVSTSRQGQRGNGLEAQRSSIESFARSEGFMIDQWVTEVETGKGADALNRRPKLAEALKASDASVVTDDPSSNAPAPRAERWRSGQGGVPIDRGASGDQGSWSGATGTRSSGGGPCAR